MFTNQATAQQALDDWVASYNRDRPHQALDMATPAEKFTVANPRQVRDQPDRTGPEWVARKVSTVGVVCVSWQQVSVGRHRAGERCDVHVGADTLQCWIGNEAPAHRPPREHRAGAQQATPRRCPDQDPHGKLTVTSVKDQPT